MDQPPDVVPSRPEPLEPPGPWATPGFERSEPVADPWSRTFPAYGPSDEPDGDGSFVHGSRVERNRRAAWYLRGWVMLLVITALAGGLRLWHLSTPKGYVFDEVYYAKDGCYDAGVPYKQCNLDNPGEQTVTVHPPVGRELIALSIRVFGNDEFGWRFASAVAGTLSVMLLALLAWKLFDSVAWGYGAGVLLATESLNLVQSRISMLDIFIALFVVAGFLFVLLDRRWIERRTPEPAGGSDADDLLDVPAELVPSPILRPFRLAAGVAFGLAAATKWSGATALIGGIVLTFAWERTRRAHAGSDRPIWEAFRDEAFGIFLFLLIVPIAVYVASYLRWFTQNHWDLSGWVHLQRSMADFSLGLRSPHPYASPAWKWILMIRPVAYFFQCPKKVGATCITAQAITGMGNPFVFWLSVPAFVYVTWSWIRRLDWRAGLVVVAIAFQYFPWFLAKRTSFFFYMTPITPFLVLAVVYLLRDVARVRVGVEARTTLAPVAWVAIFLSVAIFAFFWPVLTGAVMSWNAWHIRMWLPSWV